jgi:hypothetical protein
MAEKKEAGLFPVKRSNGQPFDTIGGGGEVTQPAMLRRESAATSARAGFLMKLSHMDAADLSAKRGTSAQKPHSRGIPRHQ